MRLWLSWTGLGSTVNRSRLLAPFGRSIVRSLVVEIIQRLSEDALLLNGRSLGRFHISLSLRNTDTDNVGLTGAWRHIVEGIFLVCNWRVIRTVGVEQFTVVGIERRK